MIKKIIASCLLMCFSFIHAQQKNEISFLNFNEIKKEISGLWISSVQQDKEGFIWAASQDGLYKYDGKNFKTFRYNPNNKNSLPANWVRSITQDINGIFWLGTQGSGLVKFDEKKSKFTTISLSSPTDNNNPLIVYDVIVTRASTVWVVSEDGLYRKALKDSSFLKIAQPTSQIQVHQLLDGTEIVMFDKKLFSYNEVTNKLDVILKDISFGRILVTGQKSIIYRSEGKLFGYDFIGNPKEIKTPNNQVVNSMSNLQNNRCLLVGATKNYIYNVSQNTFEAYNYDIEQFKSLGISELFIDKQNLLWIATNRGLFKESLLGKVFTGSLDFHTRRILKTGDTIYIGGGKGLHRLVLKSDGSKHQETIKSFRITSLCKTNAGFWFGDYYGRVFFKDKNDNIKTIDLRNDYLNPLKIYGLIEDNINRIWVSTWSGLFVLNANGDVLHKYNLKSKSDKEEVKIIKLLIDNEDNLWAITVGDGLYRIPNISEVNKEKAFAYKHYIHHDDDLNSINSDVVMEVHLNPNGDIWIGSDFGINGYNKEKDNFYPLIANGSFFDKKIMAIETDANNLMWISTINDGIYVYNNINKRLFNLKKQDGLISNACLYTSSTSDGNSLYFGTDSGLQIIDASHFSYPEVNTAPTFSELIINGGTSTVIQDLSKEHQPIKISYNQPNFSVKLAITDYRFPQKINYYYKLEENSVWIKSQDNTINFNSLNFGNYNLQVKAAYQADDVAPISTLALKIKSPWYQSITAYAFLFLAVASLLFYFFQLQYKQKLASTKLKTIKELDKIKSNLFTNISHELRTPLTLISGPIEHQLSKDNLKAVDRDELNMVKQNADRLLNLVNQLMDLALIDSGQLKLKVSQGNLNLLLKQAIIAFKYQAATKEIKINSEINQLESVWFDKDSIEKIVFNLLSNAVKYSTSNSIIEFKASQQEEALVISVVNDSLKTNKNLVRLFERFYQNDASADGVGVGLALVKELVMLNNGTILANKLQDNKIQFTVILPIEKIAFNNIDVKNNRVKNIENINVFDENLNDDTVILIVEDDNDIRAFVTKIFEKSYKIIEATNGEEGTIKALKHIPDLIISDVMMPIKDGVSLCNDLKNNQLTSHIPIVLLTAKVGEQHEITGLKTGADAYITKPFNLEKLKIRVDKLLEGRAQLQKHYSNGFNINPELKITSTETEFLKRLQEMLENHLTNSKFTSEQFAEAMQMSRTQLHRKLKALVNMTASEFIRRERLKLALQLLKETDATVSEIAYQIGFNSPSYFIKCFKDIYNCTPNEYFSKS